MENKAIFLGSAGNFLSDMQQHLLIKRLFKMASSIFYLKNIPPSTHTTKRDVLFTGQLLEMKCALTLLQSSDFISNYSLILKPTAVVAVRS